MTKRAWSPKFEVKTEEGRILAKKWRQKDEGAPSRAFPSFARWFHRPNCEGTHFRKLLDHLRQHLLLFSRLNTADTPRGKNVGEEWPAHGTQTHRLQSPGQKSVQ